ncbi:MAG: ComEC/Rec2 family competence protein, partial [Candidatus Acidiferrales bacterium]
MKLPTLWIAAAFAGGIALVGLSRSPSLGAWLPPMLTAVAVAAMALAGVFLWGRRTAAAWAAVLVVWVALGGLASGIERNSLPADHVTRLIAAGTLDTSEALRWRGRLRENPSALPWGTRFTIDLEQVEVAGQAQPISGGLRVNLYRDSRSDPAALETLMNLRAGDRVEALARARPPRDYLDPGAFDVRGYLAHQRIDLLGTLRSADLMQVVDHPEPALAQRLARARGVLLARIDTLFADHPERAAVLRAMLLGDRNFVDSQVVLEFQKTSAYHVLVVAGLHVGALAVFLFWICRKLRFSVSATSLVTLAALACYVGLVEDRTPILRAALMA